MKFAHKLTICILLLLAVVLSGGGYVLLWQNFRSSLEDAAQQNAAAHQREVYALETSLAQQLQQEDRPAEQVLYNYARGLTSRGAGRDYHFALCRDSGVTLFSNLPAGVGKSSQLAAMQAGSDAVTLWEAGGRQYMMIASVTPVATSAMGPVFSTGPDAEKGDRLWLLSCFDVSALFAARDLQLRNYLRMECLALACAAVAAALIARLLTGPIQQLERTSRAIAEGDRSRRTALKSRDEIGALSRSFDAMADTVEQTIDALADDVRRREEFVSAFTHELKTPMTSMLGYADILRSGQVPAETQRRAANYIYHETRRLEGLSAKLMLLMGLSHEEELALRPVRLAAVLGDAQRSLPDLPARLCLPAAAGTCWVMAERDLLADLVRNLVLNAAKAQPKDGAVHVDCSPGPDGVCLAVWDQGCGIPPEELAHVTEPFYMVDKSRARRENGSGLGLALCARIAQLHGTVLSIESRVGAGTRVSLLLTPCAPPADEQEVAL